ncbi:MAG: hypothetical protein Q7J03_04695 [Methanoregula sp.]|nr:hypothetical protein [Methanoregula sp.]
MTSRRCTVLEQGASEQLRLQGYEIRIIPTGDGKRLPPAHLVASKTAETRYIRIYKTSARLANIYRVEECISRAIRRYRTGMAQHPDSLIRYEIWLYTVHHGYRCFAILPDRVQKIPPLGKLPVHLLVEEA